jgi:pSer/pThr/pTyr-binding forkhead associated (FHA) protein
VEATSNNEIVIDEQRLEVAKRQWDTAVIDQHAVVAAIGPEKPAIDLSSLRQLVSESSLVYELHKTQRNRSPEICLGRAKRNDIRIEDPSVSSLHARLEETSDGDYDIVDLNSRNGTFINRERVPSGSSKRLSDGDCVRVGKRVFYYVSGATVGEWLRSYLDD